MVTAVPCDPAAVPCSLRQILLRGTRRHSWSGRRCTAAPTGPPVGSGWNQRGSTRACVAVRSTAAAYQAAAAAWYGGLCMAESAAPPLASHGPPNNAAYRRCGEKRWQGCPGPAPLFFAVLAVAPASALPLPPAPFLPATRKLFPDRSRSSSSSARAGVPQRRVVDRHRCSTHSSPCSASAKRGCSVVAKRDAAEPAARAAGKLPTASRHQTGRDTPAVCVGRVGAGCGAPSAAVSRTGSAPVWTPRRRGARRRGGGASKPSAEALATKNWSHRQEMHSKYPGNFCNDLATDVTIVPVYNT